MIHASRPDTITIEPITLFEIIRPGSVQFTASVQTLIVDGTTHDVNKVLIDLYGYDERIIIHASKFSLHMAL